MVNLSEAGLSHLPAVLDDYVRAYLELWQQVPRLEDPQIRDHRSKRMTAIRTLMKANDPGFPFMVQVFGEEATTRVFDAVF